MITDSEIRKRGMDALIKHLGEVEAERFITLIIREPFDYTESQRDLWPDTGVEELSKKAMEYVNKENKDDQQPASSGQRPDRAHIYTLAGNVIRGTFKKTR